MVLQVMIYHLNIDFIVFLIYIDNILVTGNNSILIQSLIDKLYSNFTLKDLGEISYFLNIEVTRVVDIMHFAQTKYVT